MEHEQISAWMDGELDASQSSDLAAKIAADPELRRRWQQWHLAGDILRSSSLAIGSSSLANRVSAQLASEPIHFPQAIASESSTKRREAHRSRKMVYGGAIAAAIAFVSLITIAPQMQTNLGELVASAVPGASTPAPETVLAQPATPVMLSDPRLSELLEAHGSMSIRTVSAEVR